MGILLPKNPHTVTKLLTHEEGNTRSPPPPAPVHEYPNHPSSTFLSVSLLVLRIEQMRMWSIYGTPTIFAGEINKKNRKETAVAKWAKVFEREEVTFLHP